MTKAPHAPTVSRILRNAGFMVAATRMREGMHVTGSVAGVRVTAQFDGESRAVRFATEAADELRKAGYAIEQNGAYLVATASARRGTDNAA